MTIAQKLTRDEWTHRYAARVMERAGWVEYQAIYAARTGAEVFEQDERAAGNAVTWEDPEGMADEEMSNWTDDGEG
jgi:hypothetical protein